MKLSVNEFLGKLKDEGHLREADLRKSKLKGLQASGADLGKANLSKSNLVKSDLSKTNLSFADLSGANLKDADLKGANLEGANFKKANLESCDLSGAKVDGANFTGASLRKAQMKQLEIKEAVFSGADMLGVEMDGCTLENCTSVEANYNGCEIKNLKLVGGNFSKSNFQDSKINDSSAVGCDFSEAVFSFALIENFSFTEECNFSQAELYSAEFKHVRFEKANLENANFSASDFQDTELNTSRVSKAAFKSVSGLDDELLQELKQKGAVISKKLLKKFSLFVWKSTLAKIVLVLILCAAGAATYMYMKNPENWGYDKIIQQAAEAARLQDMDLAEKYYDLALEKYKNTYRESQILYMKGQLALNKGEYSNAEKIFQTVLTDFPDNEETMFNSSMGIMRTYSLRKQYDKAISQAQQILKEWEYFHGIQHVYRMLADLYLEIGQEEKALTVIDDFLAKYSEDKDSVISGKMMLAEMHRKLGEPDKALQVYLELSKMEFDEEGTRNVFNSIVDIYINKKEYEKASAALEELLKESPENNSFKVAYLKGKARVAERQGNRDEALRLNQELVNDYPKDPSIPWIMNNMANMYWEQGKEAEAMAILSKLGDRFGKDQNVNIQLILNKARIAREKGDLEQAFQLNKKLVDQYPNSSEVNWAKFNMARIQIDMGENDQAMELLNELAESSQTVTELMVSVLQSQSMLYQKKGDQEKSIEILMEIEQKYSDEKCAEWIYEVIAARYNEYGNMDLAEKYYRKSIEKHSGNQPMAASGYRGLAHLEMKRDNPEGALALYSEIEEKYGEIDSVRQWLPLSIANTLTHMQRYDEAKTIFDGLLADENSDENAQTNALLGLIQIYRQNREFAKAIELMDSIFEKQQKTNQYNHLRTDYAYLLLDSGDISKAEAYFQKQLQSCKEVKNHRCREAKLGMVNVFERRGDYKNALDALIKVKQEYPVNVEGEWVNMRIARFNKRLGAKKEAEALFKSMLERCELNYQLCREAYSEYANMMVENNEKAMAIQLYEKAITDLAGKTETGDLVNNLANLYLGVGNRDKAFQLFKDNQKSANSQVSINALLGTARLYRQKGKSQKALQAYDQVILKSDDQWQIKDATVEKAAILRQMGDVQKGIDLMTALEEKFADNEKLALSLSKSIAHFYRTDRQYEKAIAIYSGVLDGYKKNNWNANWIMLEFASLYQEINDFENADALYTELDQIDEQDDELTRNVMLGRSGLLSKMGKKEEAVQVLDQVMEKWPNWSELGNVAMRKAGIINSMGRNEELATLLESILSKYSEDEQLSLNATNMLAQAKQALGKENEAAKYYEELIKRNPDSGIGIWASISYAGLELRRKNYDKAEELLQEILQKKKLLPEQRLAVYNNLTSLARDREHYSKAIEYQQKIIQKYKGQYEEGRALHQIANIYEKMGKKKEMEKVYTEISERFSNHKDLQLIAIKHRARTFRSQKDLAAAVQENQKIVDRYPGTYEAAQARIDIALIYRESQDHEKAIELLKEIRQEVVGRSELEFVVVRELAESVNRIGDHGKAVEYYMEASKLAPDPQSKIHITQMLARLYVGEERFAEAKEMLDHVLSSEYTDTNQRINVKKMVAEIQEKSGNQKGAIKTYKQILEDYPDGNSTPWVGMSLANIYRKKKMNQEAIAIYKMIQKKWGNDNKQLLAQAYIGESIVLQEMGKYKEAIELLNKIRKAMPNRSEAGQAMLLIGQVYNRMGDKAKAKAVFNDVLRLYTRNPNLSKQAILELANLAANESDNKTAITLYKQLAQQFKGKDVAARSMMSIARLHLRGGNPKEAETILLGLQEEYKEEAIAMDIRQLMADTKQAKWEYEAAVKLYQDIIQEAPRSRHAIRSMTSLAHIYSKTGRFELAEESYVRILDMNSFFNDPNIQTSARMGLADLAARQKKYDEAAIQYREIINEIPGTESAGWAQAKIGDILVGQKKDEEAEAVYKEILKKHSEKNELRFHVLIHLAQIKSRQEDFNSAIGIYMSIVKSAKGTIREGQALMDIARIYYMEKEYDKASALLEDIIERFQRDKRLVQNAYALQKNIKKLSE